MGNSRGEDDVGEKAGRSAQAMKALVGADKTNNGVSGIIADLDGGGLRVHEAHLSQWEKYKDQSEVIVHAL